MFKRRTPRTYYESAVQAFYPRGGWRRASRYVMHRLQRLPDPAYKIARGISAGVFVSFTPFYGLHFVLAAGLAWVMRGNMLAALLATFFGNPVTFPIIAAISVEIGSVLLGQEPVPLPQVLTGFSYASMEIWSNLAAFVTGDVVSWEHLPAFTRSVFWPYLVGGLAPGILAGAIAFTISRPIITAYQKARIRRLKKRFEHPDLRGPG